MTDSQIKWDDSFLIGIEELDYEHKQLINDINRLHRELTRQSPRLEIEKCLGEIHARMGAHFALEERVMKEQEYEFFDAHKREHDMLLDEYTEYMTRFLNSPENSLDISIEKTLNHWIRDHILSSDKKMSAMI